MKYNTQGCQNRDFTSGRKRIAKSELVKSRSKSKSKLKDYLRNFVESI